MSPSINDARYGIRQLHKRPGFTLLAVLTLALGIGTVATLHSVFRTWVSDPFPYADADRIVHVWSDIAKDGEGPLSSPDSLDLREQNRSFSHMARTASIALIWVVTRRSPSMRSVARPACCVSLECSCCSGVSSTSLTKRTPSPHA